jgi:hypothetical protein
MINSLDFLKLKEQISKSRLSNDFEKSLMQSILNYNASNFIRYNGFKENIGVNMTYKQEDIVEKLFEKYKDDSIDGDLYDKYTRLFEEKGVELNSFDKRHLETFKGIINESENFKKWVSEILPAIIGGYP